MKQDPVKYTRVSKKRLKAASDAMLAEMDARAAARGNAPVEVRTNIVMEEPLVMEAQEVTGIKTKTGVVHYALSELVRRARQKEILKFHGKVAWDGDLDEMRKSRH